MILLESPSASWGPGISSWKVERHTIHLPSPKVFPDADIAKKKKKSTRQESDVSPLSSSLAPGTLCGAGVYSQLQRLRLPQGGDSEPRTRHRHRISLQIKHAWFWLTEALLWGSQPRAALSVQ